jgi:hypothetical protein
MLFSLPVEDTSNHQTTSLLKSHLPLEVNNLLKHVYSQQEFETPFILHQSIELLETVMQVNHCISETRHLGKIKEDCRTHWYLTLTKTTHPSQNCNNRKCCKCSRLGAKTIDLSDADLESTSEGNVCLVDNKKPTPDYSDYLF